MSFSPRRCLRILRAATSGTRPVGTAISGIALTSVLAASGPALAATGHGTLGADRGRPDVMQAAATHVQVNNGSQCTAQAGTPIQFLDVGRDAGHYGYVPTSGKYDHDLIFTSNSGDYEWFCAYPANTSNDTYEFWPYGSDTCLAVNNSASPAFVDEDGASSCNYENGLGEWYDQWFPLDAESLNYQVLENSHGSCMYDDLQPTAILATCDTSDTFEWMISYGILS
jgi:hypothetical protein